MKKKKGFISIEYIIAASLILIVGVWGAPKVFDIGKDIVKDRGSTTEEHINTLRPSTGNIQGTGEYESTNTIPQIPDDVIKPGDGDIIEFPEDNIQHPTGVKIKKKNEVTWSENEVSVTMKVGEQIAFEAEVIPENSQNKKIRWVNMNEKIALANQNGLVKALSPGVATIRVEAVDNNKFNTIKVTVEEVYPESISVVPNPLELVINSSDESKQLEVQFATTEKNNRDELLEVTHKVCTFTSADPKIVAVDNTGKATGMKTITQDNNKTNITVECEAKNNQKIAVNVPVEVIDNLIETESITLDPLKSTLEVGKQLTIKATVLPTNATDKRIEWESSDPSIATVNGGVVSGLRPGQVYIYARNYAGDYYGKEIMNAAYVNVIPRIVPVTGISIGYNKSEVEVGKGLVPHVTFTPSNTTQTELVWSVSDSSKLSINEVNGQIKGLKKTDGGTVRIKACSKVSPGICSTFDMKVIGEIVNVQSVDVNPKTLNLVRGQTGVLQATVSPSNATNPVVRWETSNSAIATVSSQGTVTGIAEGSCIISAITEDGGRVATAVVNVSDVKVNKVTLNVHEITMSINSIYQLNAIVEPDNASVKRLAWTVEPIAPGVPHEGIIDVDTTGKITSKSYGDVKVVASAIDGSNVRDEVIVHVVPKYVTSLFLTPQNVTLAKSTDTKLSQQKFNVAIEPADADNKSVTWKSLDEELFTVDNNGLVTAGKTKTGTAQLEVKWDVYSDRKVEPVISYATVTVAPTLVSMIEAVDSISMNVGDQLNVIDRTSEGAETMNGVKYKVYPIDADNKNIKLTSSDPNVLAVDSFTITAVGLGNATLTLSAIDGSGVTKNIDVIVNGEVIPLQNFTVSPEEIALELNNPDNNSVQLTTVFEPANATNKILEYSSSNDAVATVDTKGVIRATGKGEAYITITHPETSIWQTVHVTVTGIDVKGLSVTPKIIEGYVSANKYEFNVTILPNDADQTWTYRILNENKEPIISEGGFDIGNTKVSVYQPSTDASASEWQTGHLSFAEEGTYYVRISSSMKPSVYDDIKVIVSANGPWDGYIEEPLKDADGFCIINNARKLAWVRYAVSTPTEDLGMKCPSGFKQTTDIDMAAGQKGADGNPLSFSEIGDDQRPFATTYDGQGFTIKNVGKAEGCGTDNVAGLFGHVTGTVKNLTVENYVQNGLGCSVGSVVGHLGATGTIDKVHTINPTVSSEGTDVSVGGAVGIVDRGGTINGIEVRGGTIDGKNAKNVGGIIGYVDTDPAHLSIRRLEITNNGKLIRSTIRSNDAMTNNVGIVWGDTKEGFEAKDILIYNVDSPDVDGKKVISGDKTIRYNEYTFPNIFVKGSGDVMINYNHINPQSIAPQGTLKAGPDWISQGINKAEVSVINFTNVSPAQTIADGGDIGGGGGTDWIGDISLEGNNSISAYLDYRSGTLHIYSPNLIKFNADSSNMFQGFDNVNSIWFNNIDTSRTVDMSGMFKNLKNLYRIKGLDQFNVQNVVNMSSMFQSTGYNVDNLNIEGMDKWNVSNAKNMELMFSRIGANATTWSIGDLSNWDVRNVTSMRDMFNWAGKNTTAWTIGDLSNWNVGKVIDMHNMFTFAGANSSAWNVGNLSNWNVSSVTDMSGMFNGAGKNSTIWNIGDLSQWDVSNVTNMFALFEETGNKSKEWDIGNISNWNISNVVDMGEMFYHSEMVAGDKITLDLSKWDLRNVAGVYSMLYFEGQDINSKTREIVIDLPYGVTNDAVKFNILYGTWVTPDGQHITTDNFPIGNTQSIRITNTIK